MRTAAVDIGTNSCRLLIADVAGGELTAVHRGMETSRIGEGSSAGGVLKPEAIERTMAVLASFLEVMRRHETDKYRAVATSAIREAGNQTAFIRRVKEELGLAIQVISGEEEAWLSYQGVLRGLSLPRDPVVVDLGGGSTELVWRGRELNLLSLPVGAVRASELGMKTSDIKVVLAPLQGKKADFEDRPLVFVGGTATTVVAVKLGLTEYDRHLVHGHILKIKEIEAVYRRLAHLTIEQRAATPGVQAARADIIVPGILVMLKIIEELGRKEVTICESDLMDAIAVQVFEESETGSNIPY